MNLELKRDDEFGQSHNWGVLFVDGTMLGQTLEDPDRQLEEGGTKIASNTAIPRGWYRLSITFSNRFQKLMPYVHDVPGFEGIRIHGGNTEENTDGCPLLGQRRTADGIADCAGVNQRLMHLLEAAEDLGEEVWMEVT